MRRGGGVGCVVGVVNGSVGWMIRIGAVDGRGVEGVGLGAVQVDGTHDDVVRPEPWWRFGGRLEEGLLDELVALQSAAALEAGWVSAEHLVADTFPVEQGSQRVTDATTLYKAKKKSSSSSPR